MRAWLNERTGTVHRRKTCTYSGRHLDGLTPIRLPDALLVGGRQATIFSEQQLRDALPGVPCSRCLPELVERWPGEFGVAGVSA